MILQNILKYRNGSNFAHTLLNTIKSSDANPPEKIFFDHVTMHFTKKGLANAAKPLLFKVYRLWE